MPLDFKPIIKLKDKQFFIPKYQRGYRWTKQLVKDLLDDIDEFIQSKKQEKQGGTYSLQPLVVKQHTNNKWEIIDGQQRLTTIYLLLSFLKSEIQYGIEYETRANSKEYLSKITPEKREENSDYFHIYNAYEQIKDWFENKEANFKKDFLHTLLNDVKFIWYEAEDKNPIDVFTRLNIGKIPLTNAELIKALFLNRSNFRGADYEKIRLKQQEIASEWDQIEYTLQNDEFWLFLNKAGYNKPTRIDFIFDIICKKNLLEITNDEKEIGSDEHRTFRYFYNWFKDISDSHKDISYAWRKIKNIFQTFQEWFNDLELYHYIGFLIEQNEDLSALLDKWDNAKTKKEFLKNFVKEKIKEKIKNCSDLDKEHQKQSEARSILLLYNIQTMINQNKSFKENQKYKLPVYYKFPFHLFKKEKWDVEHIDSYTENTLENKNINKQKEWLKAASIVIKDENLKQEIISFISDTNKSDSQNKDTPEENEQKFQELYNKIIKPFSSENKLDDTEKNKLWNFALLDSSTNRGYGNSVFPAKRRVIIAKNQGKKIEVDENLNLIEENKTIAFIPPCTQKVFLKYYTVLPNNLLAWDKDDAKAYKKNIEETLKEFINK